MSGYEKRIAVIKQIKGGFSADGGELSGLVKVEVYAGFLKAEISLINFAPLSEGAYTFALSDGEHILTFDQPVYECQTPFSLARGFAALVCFRKNGIFPLASASCGQCGDALLGLRREIGKNESAPPPRAGNGRKGKTDAGREESGDDRQSPDAEYGKESGRAAEGDPTPPYEDEAIAEDNYYEYEDSESCGAVREDQEQARDGQSRRENETAARAVQSESAVGRERGRTDDRTDGRGGGAQAADGQARPIRFADGDFYDRMKGDIEGIFSSFPHETRLEKLVEGSRWAKISYGDGKFYVFGVIYEEKKARYVCYGVPSADGTRPPQSMKDRASYLPVEGGGFWVMYQDAGTGVSIKIAAE